MQIRDQVAWESSDLIVFETMQGTRAEWLDDMTCLIGLWRRLRLMESVHVFFDW
jgi:hypothetical protein